MESRLAATVETMSQKEKENENERKRRLCEPRMEPNGCSYIRRQDRQLEQVEDLAMHAIAIIAGYMRDQSRRECLGEKVQGARLAFDKVLQVLAQTLPARKNVWDGGLLVLFLQFVVAYHPRESLPGKAARHGGCG